MLGLQRILAPKPNKEPDIPEVPGYDQTPVLPIEVDPLKQLTAGECTECVMQYLSA